MLKELKEMPTKMCSIYTLFLKFCFTSLFFCVDHW